MPFAVHITAPGNGVHFESRAQYRVVGTIQGRPADDPPVLAAVEVQAPGRRGPVQTTAKGHGLVTFAADGVMPSSGRVTITAIATDEDGHSFSAHVTVSVGLEYSPTAPVILLDLVPKYARSLFSMAMPKLQNAAKPLSTRLDQSGSAYRLVGPNTFERSRFPPPADPALPPNASVGTDRWAFWLVDRNLDLNPPPYLLTNPPELDLPVLPEPAVSPSFRGVPEPTVPDPMSTPDVFGFGLTISQSALQVVADALLPLVKGEAAKSGLSIDSIAVQCAPPNLIQTVVVGNRSGLGFTLTITETVGIVASSHAATLQMVPSVTGMATVDSAALPWLEALLVAITPLSGAILGIYVNSSITGAVQSANNALSVANAAFSGIPEIIAFHAAAHTDTTVLEFGGLFPGVFPNWTALTANASGLYGTGTLSMRPRVAADTSLVISGPNVLHGSPSDLTGGASARYTVSWLGIIPDADALTITTGRQGAVDAYTVPVARSESPVESAPVTVTFPFPADPPAPGRYNFTLTVNATETSRLDGSKTLSASGTLLVSVVVGKPRPHPPIGPRPTPIDP